MARQPFNKRTTAPLYPPYDPKTGPVITPEMWTEEMLTWTCPLTQDLLSNQTDPAGFTNTRRALRETPTPAVVVTEYDGVVHSTDPLNPVTLSSQTDATNMLAHLRTLGMNPDLKEEETELGGGAQRYEWNGETRRQWIIDALNVGLLCLRYAVLLVDDADAETTKELQTNGMMR